MNDPIRTIAQLRPSESDVDALWSPNDRASMIEDIVGSRRRSHWRRTSLIGAAGIAAAAVIVAMLPGGGRTPARGPSPTHAPPVKLAAATVALHHLATVAATAPHRLGDGRYWHMTVREHQVGGDTPERTTTMDGWTDQAGRLWRHDTETGGGSTQQNYYEFPPGSDQVNYPTPAYLRSLPTDPDALYAFLDAHVAGSSSHEEAIFVAVGDMLRGGFAPPELRAAAIQVLTQLPHVSLSDVTVDGLGRTVQQFNFVDESIRPGEIQSMSFDPQTAQILDEGISAHGGEPLIEVGPSGRRTVSSDLDFTSSVLVADTVDHIPADVLHNAVPQHG